MARNGQGGMNTCVTPQVPQYQKKTGRYQNHRAKQYGRARALLGLLVGTKMRPPVLGAWCAVAPGRLGPTRKPSEQDSKKNTGEHLQRLPRHADAASLGAVIAIIHRAMGLQKTGSRKLEYQSFYPMHRFVARSGIAPTEHSETVFCSAGYCPSRGHGCSE